MAFWRTYYHLVWATENRQPLITEEVEQALYGYIKGKATHLGCLLHAIGGIEDHVHLVLSIPPKHSVAEIVGRLKGSSAHHINHRQSQTEIRLKWQRGYGVFTLGSKQLATAVAYVKQQKEHHQRGTVHNVLERDGDEED